MSIGQDLPHDSSRGHVTGESIFIDDRLEVAGEVFVGVVGSPIASGELLSIDSKAALAHPACLGVYTARDFVGKHWGSIVHDQPFLVETKINYMQEAVCLVVSSGRETLEEIKSLVRLETKSAVGVFSITDAKKAQTIIARAQKPFVQGNADLALKKAPHRLRGVFVCGGQEHFYLESQAAIAYPLENGQLEVHSSSQHPSETQRVVAEALGLPLHHVVCVVKRMGGAFGGKESQGAPIAAYAALAAAKLKRPARIAITKDQDMMLTGKRHPFENEYEVGFDERGKILAFKVLIQSDGGAYADLSSSILERAMFHVDGAYSLENVWIDGVCYRTNNTPHTAFRGFGGPQGNMTIEAVIEEIAQHLKMDASEVRRINLYRDERNLTPYGNRVENNMLPAIYDRLMATSDYQKRYQEIEAENLKRTGRVRGISITATKFGIAFTSRFLNQANALVNLHLDATVQVSTGATEMGQGVNTKIQQIVAHEFGIESTRVQIMPTSTEKNHNTSPTAASSGADINGAAARNAALQIKCRLIALARKKFSGELCTPLAEYELSSIELGQLPVEVDPDFVFEGGDVLQKSTGHKITLKELITIAYQNRISLGAYAFYKTPDLGFDKTKVEGRAFNYFTQGMAVSEVSIDEYTGEMKILRSDILMDLGRPLNPGIDRGQVVGGFVQGAGWVTTENLFYDQERNLISHSPTTYKIPNIQDTPRDLRVDFIENLENDRNVHGSKAVGEPPLLLGTSVWTAVKHALRYRSKGPTVNISSPATGEVILNELTRLKGV